MKVFYSYSHQDEALRGELETHLAVVKRNELITDWHDGEIPAGTEWDAEIKRNLNAADIILLLVSPDFLASDYIWEVELQQAIERHEAGQARVIPIILRLCDWQNSTLGKLQALPKDGKPITKWEDRDEAFLDVVRGIRKVLETPILPKTSSFSSTLITDPPIVRNWVGREDAIAQIQNWIVDPSVTLIGIQGLGGVGKSALAAHIYDKFCKGEMPPTSSRVHKFQWADVSQKPDFVAFAEGIVTGLGGKIIQPGDINLVVNQLIKFLNQQSCLLVVDNLETLLTETEDWQDSGYEKFFIRWIQYGQSSTLLLTTREKPNLFKSWKYWHSLEGLKPKKGAQLLQELKIKATEAELEAFSQSVDGHPLTLGLVAGFLRDCCGSELSRVDELELEQEELIFEEAEGQHHERTNARLSWILDQHLQRLTPEEQHFLLNLTVYRQPFDSEAAVWMWQEDLTPLTPLPCEGRGEPDTSIQKKNSSSSSPLAGGTEGGREGPGERSTVKPFRILKELATLRNRSLLLEIGGNRFQFQFLIQRYLQQILVRQYLQQQRTDFTFAHQQALKYYLSYLKPEPWDSLDDVSEYLEACYHHCQLQEYAQAYEMAERCHTFLDLQGDNQKLVEVYGTLAQEWQPESIEDKAKWAWAWTRQGCAYFSIGEYRSAIQCQLQAQQVFCDICNRRGEARALRSLGYAYVSTGEYQQAIKLFQRCLGICRAIRERKEEMIALRGLGNAYYSLAEYRRAIRFYEKSLKIAKEIGDCRGEANSLSSLGNAYVCLGEYQQAIDIHHQSSEIAREIGDRAGEANSLSSLGHVYLARGEYQQGIEFSRQSLEIMREIGARSNEESILSNLGYAYCCLGEYGRAIESYQQSLEIAKEIGARLSEAGSCGSLGWVYFYLGEYQRAIDLYKQQLAIAREIGSRADEANSLGSLGSVYLALGEYQQAINFHQQALKIAREIGDRRWEAGTCSNLGNVYLSLGEYQQAIELYQQSLKISNEIGSRYVEADALTGLGKAYNSLGQPQQAIEFHQQSLKIAQEIGQRDVETDAYCGLGDVYRSLEQYTEARDYYQQSLDIAKEINYRRGEADADFNLGLVLAKLNCPSEAVTVLQNARQLYQQMGLEAKVQECDSEISKVDI